MQSAEASRRRVSLACTPCRKNKVSCENARPCFRCLRSGCPDECVDPKSRKRGPKSSRQLEVAPMQVKRVVVEASPKSSFTYQPRHPLLSSDSRANFAFGLVFQLFNLHQNNGPHRPPLSVMQRISRAWGVLMTGDQFLFITNFLQSCGLVEQMKALAPMQFCAWTEDMDNVIPNTLTTTQLNRLPLPAIFCYSILHGPTYFYPNDEATRYWGYTREEMQDMFCHHQYTLFSNLTDPAYASEQMRKAGSYLISQVPEFTIECRDRLKSGQIRASSCTYTAEYHPGGHIKSFLSLTTPKVLSEEDELHTQAVSMHPYSTHVSPTQPALPASASASSSYTYTTSPSVAVSAVSAVSAPPMLSLPQERQGCVIEELTPAQSRPSLPLANRSNGSIAQLHTTAATNSLASSVSTSVESFTLDLRRSRSAVVGEEVVQGTKRVRTASVYRPEHEDSTTPLPSTVTSVPVHSFSVPAVTATIPRRRSESEHDSFSNRPQNQPLYHSVEEFQPRTVPLDSYRYQRYQQPVLIASTDHIDLRNFHLRHERYSTQLHESDVIASIGSRSSAPSVSSAIYISTELPDVSPVNMPTMQTHVMSMPSRGVSREYVQAVSSAPSNSHRPVSVPSDSNNMASRNRLLWQNQANMHPRRSDVVFTSSEAFSTATPAALQHVSPEYGRSFLEQVQGLNTPSTLMTMMGSSSDVSPYLIPPFNVRRHDSSMPVNLHQAPIKPQVDMHRHS